LLRLGKKYKTGIILSGGGARGFAHAGILKALQESGIYPDVISGVSAGAIVGALYADGHTPDEIFRIFNQEDKFFDYAEITIPKTGFFKTKGLRENLYRSLRAKRFEDLQTPLFIAATDLNRGKVVYFNSGDLLDKILASASIPVLFEPVEIDGTCYVDGGVMDNFPVAPIERDCKELIGISVNPLQEENEFNSLFSISERTFRLSTSSNMDQKKRLCSIFLEPDELAGFGMLDVSSGEEMFELGYRNAMAQINT
jgi:NTE family protein